MLESLQFKLLNLYSKNDSLSLPTKLKKFNCLFNKMILGKDGFYFRSKKDLLQIVKEGLFFETKPKINLKYFSKEFINESYLNLIKNQGK